MTDIPELLNLPPATAAKYRAMPAPPRAYALAKAMHETADQQYELAKAVIMARYEPEPKLPAERPISKAAGAQWRADHDAWVERMEAAGLWRELDAALQAHKVTHYFKLMLEAERNLVEWAQDNLQRKDPVAFARVQSAFAAYFDGSLHCYGKLRQQFIDICYNCPEHPHENPTRNPDLAQAQPRT